MRACLTLREKPRCAGGPAGGAVASCCGTTLACSCVHAMRMIAANSVRTLLPLCALSEDSHGAHESTNEKTATRHNCRLWKKPAQMSSSRAQHSRGKFTHDVEKALLYRIQRAVHPVDRIKHDVQLEFEGTCLYGLAVVAGCRERIDQGEALTAGDQRVGELVGLHPHGRLRWRSHVRELAVQHAAENVVYGDAYHRLPGERTEGQWFGHLRLRPPAGRRDDHDLALAQGFAPHRRMAEVLHGEADIGFVQQDGLIHHRR